MNENLKSTAYAWRFYIGIGLFLVFSLVAKNQYESRVESQKQAQSEAETKARAERIRQKREQLAAIEAAKSPEQREADRVAHEAKALADEKARIAQVRAEAVAEKERAKRPENIIMANAKKSAKIYEDGDNLVVECNEYIFPYEINSRLKWVQAVCDADATIRGGPRSIFFYDPSGKKFAQADTLRGIRLTD